MRCYTKLSIALLGVPGVMAAQDLAIRNATLITIANGDIQAGTIVVRGGKITAGLSADDALRASTVTPAALLGITAAVGTIEIGKLANLVVVSGNDLFAANTPIKHVFVEGRLY